MKAVRLMAIAVLTSVAAILVFSSAAGHRLEHESPSVIFDYDVTNDYGILFADEFERLGGAEALGYPASYRFRLDDGFVYQVTQGALLQWRPEVRKAYLGNTFEMLEKAGYDQWLLDTKGIPLPIKEDGSGGDWNRARQTRLAWLTNDKITAKYLANPNPEGIASWSEDRAIELYGLPMSFPEKHGPFVTQRFQRVAFQLWVDEVQGMPAVGTVVRVLGGDLLKEACLVPSHALAPAERSTCASSTIGLPTVALAPAFSTFALPVLSLGSSPPRSDQQPASNPPPSTRSSDSPPRSDPPRSDPTQVPDPPQQQDPPSPTIEISGLATSMRVGTSTSFTVNATNLDSSKSYSIQVSTSNTNLGFNGGCTDQQDEATVPADDTSHTSILTLRACSTGGGIVTATLLQDGASVDTDTHSLTVTTAPRPVSPPTPTISISGLVSTMDRGDNAPFTVTASNLDSSASYTIDVSTDDTGIGFDNNCSDRQETVDVQSQSLHNISLTLYGCATGGGTITATLSRAGSTVDTATHSLTVTTPPPPPTPTIRISELVSPMDRGDNAQFTVTASNLDSSASYTIDVSTNDTGIGFDSNCANRQETVDVQSQSLHNISRTLYGCATAGGTVTATLSRDGSTVDTATQTVTVVPPGISIKISDLVSSLVEGETDSFSVTAENLESSETYKILLTSSNGAVGFHGYCTFDRVEYRDTTGRTSYTISHTLKACATPGGTVKATLLSDGSEVISATQYLTVQPDLSPKIAMRSFFGIYKLGAGHSPFTVSASNLDPSKEYRILMNMEDNLDNKGGSEIEISFDRGCSIQEKEVTVQSGRTSYSGKVNLQACDATDGTVTAKLLEDDSEVDSATHRIKVRADVRPNFYGPDDITDITVGNTAKLRFTLDGLDSTKTYTVLFETSAAGIGFNSDCSVKSVTKLLSDKTYYSVPNEDFAGSDTLHGCTGGGGRVTAKVYRGDFVTPGTPDLPVNAHRIVSHSVNVRD